MSVHKESRESAKSAAALQGKSLPSTSHVPHTIQQKWNQRYTQGNALVNSEPTPFVTSCLSYLSNHGQALDIAAGTGRHSIALAQQGLHVDAVDISDRGLYVAKKRTALAGITSEQIRFIVADLERPWLPCGQYDVILVSLFLCRPLFPLIKSRLRPGGWLIYQTFVKADTSTNDNTPVRSDFSLDPNELYQAFADFEIVHYEEPYRNHRAMAQLLAKKVMPYD